MNLLQESIVEIYSEKEYERVIVIDALIDSYGGKRRLEIGFLKRDWEKIKKDMTYWDNQYLTPEGVRYFEKMSEDDWHSRYHKVNLKDFTDEEIVEEFNKRLKNNLWNEIRFEGKAVIKSRI